MNLKLDHQGYVKDSELDNLKCILMSFLDNARKYDPERAAIYQQALDKLIKYGTETVSENIVLYLQTEKWGLANKLNSSVTIKNEAIGLGVLHLAEHG